MERPHDRLRKILIDGVEGVLRALENWEEMLKEEGQIL